MTTTIPRTARKSILVLDDSPRNMGYKIVYDILNLLWELEAEGAHRKITKGIWEKALNYYSASLEKTSSLNSSALGDPGEVEKTHPIQGAESLTPQVELKENVERSAPRMLIAREPLNDWLTQLNSNPGIELRLANAWDNLNRSREKKSLRELMK